MKKTFLYLLVLFFSFSITNAQQTVQTTQSIHEFESGKKGEKNKGSVTVNNKIYIITQSGGIYSPKIAINRFDLSMKLEKTIDINYDRKDGYYDDIRVLDGKVILLFNKLDRVAKETELFVRFLNLEKFILESEKHILSKKKYVETYNFFSLKVLIENKTLLVYQDLNGKKRSNPKLNLIAFDSELSELWTKEITLQTINKEADIKEIILSKEGNVYFSVLNKVDKKEIWELFACKEKGNKIINNKLKTLPEEIDDLIIDLTENGELVTAGFYYKKIANGWRKGSFFAKIDKNNLDISNITKEIFSIELLAQYKSNQTKIKADKKEEKQKSQTVDDDLYLKEIVMKENGGVYLIGQRERDRKVQTGESSLTIVEREEILVISIDANGSIIWEKLIPKVQSSSNFYDFLGYNYILKNDELIFVFNDNLKNHQKVDNTFYEMSSNKKFAVITLVKLDVEGAMSKQILTDMATTECMLVTKDSQQISENQLILFLKDRKNLEKGLLVSFK